jgi:2-aminophenol/2-amino-5-chlorophenol 1,6-dioxygenase alpha subunit
MPVVAAFLVPGNPLAHLQPDNPPWNPIHKGYQAAGEALATSGADVLAVYSTQWVAVLDQNWQTRPHIKAMHVDENWHEFGDLHFEMKIDTELTTAVIPETTALGVRSKEVNYDAFPIDTGTIVANNYLNADGSRSLLIGSNNLYHDWELTEKLSSIVVEQADKLGRKVAIVGVGGLSGTIFREEIDIAEDHIANESDDQWNQKMLDLMVAGKAEELKATAPDYAQKARVDMGFKHFAWLLGAMGGQFRGAKVHAYGPAYGSGAAVVEFVL